MGSDQQQIQRWESQSDADKEVWKYFDQEVATSIVKGALQSKTLTLSDLYHALSMARIKCEWVKSKSPTTQAEIELYAKNNMPSIYYEYLRKEKFGCYQNAQSHEPNIFSAESWGNAAALTKARVVNDDRRERIGLSYLRWGNGVEHPSGYILDLLEKDFKKLVNTSDIYEYLTLTARMIFELSNYPPITRGSLAVNKWIFNKIFQTKFQTKAHIIPLNADWMAFYETPEQFSACFMISALGAYLKTKPDIYEKNKDFLDGLYDAMVKDPNVETNLAERELIWNKLKSIANEQTADWNLEFRHPSAQVIELVNNINSNNITAIDVAYFTQLLQLHYKLSESHIQSFGNQEKEHELNKLWVDLEFLRQIPQDRLDELATTLNLTIDRPNKTQAPKHDFYYDIGHTTVPDDVIKALDPPSLYESPFSYHDSNLKRGMINGGISLRQVVDSKWSSETCHLLGCEAAILLYNSHTFIRADQLVTDTPEEIENNILRLIAKIYLNIEIKNIESDSIREMLLSPIAVELYKTGDPQVSQLFSVGTDEFFQDFLKLSLTNYFHENRKTDHIDAMSNEERTNCAENLILILCFLDTLSKEQPLKNPPHELFKQWNIEASVLMHLDADDAIRLLSFKSRPPRQSIYAKNPDYTKAQQNYQNWANKIGTATTKDIEPTDPSPPRLEI